MTNYCVVCGQPAAAFPGDAFCATCQADIEQGQADRRAGNYWATIDDGAGGNLKNADGDIVWQEYRNHQPYGEPAPW